eukprot:scaffold138095_cov20-Tisochrysis_lutea.AAC.1
MLTQGITRGLQPGILVGRAEAGRTRSPSCSHTLAAQRYAYRASRSVYLIQWQTAWPMLSLPGLRMKQNWATIQDCGCSSCHCCMFFQDGSSNSGAKVHEEFKELVDKLLTEFLEELGTKPEAFFETVTQQLDKDKFTEFVVNTILTVDDFLMFKAMMVRRNVDLTNQLGMMVQSVATYALARKDQKGGPHVTALHALQQGT